jgi:hypothetical protein
VRVDGRAQASGEAGVEPVPAVEIEVSGVPDAELAVQPGVLSVRREDDRLVVLVQPDDSDEVLRRLLASGEDVHVLKVGRSPGPAAAPEQQDGSL